jgi:hypothetical protein
MSATALIPSGISIVKRTGQYWYCCFGCCIFFPLFLLISDLSAVLWHWRGVLQIDDPETADIEYGATSISGRAVEQNGGRVEGYQRESPRA